MTDRQPWRYRCPNCGSVDIRKAALHSIPTSKQRKRGKMIEQSGTLRKRSYLVPRWRCHVCRAKFDTPRDMLNYTHHV